MKRNYLIPMLAIMMIFSTVACNKKNGKTNDRKSDSTAVVKDENSDVNKAGHRYEDKSGYVVMNSVIMKMNQVITMYWDNYGEKEITEISMEIMGTKMNQIQFVKDGYMYNLDMNKKTGSKMKMSGPDQSKINFKNITDEMKTEMNLKQEGKETFMGKECDKYSIDYKTRQMKGTYLVWKGIAVKTEMEMPNMKMKMEATKIETGTAFPEDKYNVPSDFKITETK